MSTRLEELIEEAWGFQGLPGSSDRYIIYACTLVSMLAEHRGSAAELIELLGVGAPGIPEDWRTEMLENAKSLAQLECLGGMPE